MDQLQRIHALLEFDVFIGELGPVFGLAQLLFDHLLRARSKGRKVGTISQSNERLEKCQQERDSGGESKRKEGGSETGIRTQSKRIGKAIIETGLTSDSFQRPETYP